MKLEIIKTGTYTQNCRIFELRLSGSIKLWEYPTKKIQAPLIFDLTTMSAITTLYIEATNVSSSVRDINIKGIISFDENDIQREQIEDEVNATAIWVEINNIYTDPFMKIGSPNPNNPPITIHNAGLINLIEKSSINGLGVRAKDQSRYGFGSFCEGINYPIYSNEDIFDGGRILFEFDIKPISIIPELNSLGIIFDVGRRLASVERYFEIDKFYPTNINIPVPNKREVANDDPQTGGSSDNIDEDKILPLIYSFDGPASPRLFINLPNQSNNIFSYLNRIATFQEFVRVSFNPNPNAPLIGNVYAGGSCSDFINWGIDYATISYGSLTQDGKKYNYDYHFSNIIGPNLLVSTFPTFGKIGARGNGIQGNGNITIIPKVAGANKNYYIKCELSNNQIRFTIFQQTSNGFVALGSTLSSTNGPWNFTHNFLDILISNGSEPFLPGDFYYSRILVTPVSIQNKIIK